MRNLWLTLKWFGIPSYLLVKPAIDQAITNDDGTFDVHCLDGAAWDRPTWYGAAPTLAAAESLGAKKLAEWKQNRAQPMSISEGGKILIVRMPQRPDWEHEVLKAFDSEADATAFLSSLM